MLPDFLLIGASRCGTGYIAANLRSHPEIFVPSRKELHFFDRDYDKGLDYYESQLTDNSDGRYTAIGEATPAYLYFPEIPERIKTHLPDCKLIISLRNPVDAAYSSYWLLYSKDEGTRRQSFEEKLKTAPRLIERGKYYTQLSRYLEYFPKEQLHIMIFEEMLSNAGEEYRKLFSFIGVNENFKPPLLYNKVNSSGIALNKMKNARFLYYFHRLFLKYVQLPGLSERIEKWGAVDIPPMAQQTREMLVREFKDDTRKLETLLGRKLSCWDIS